MTNPPLDDDSVISLPNGIRVRLAHLDDFKPDPHNANLHTERGRSMLQAELKLDGYGRPMLAAADGTMLAGNLTKQVVDQLQIGDGRVLVVETDGDIPIVHQRRDLPDSDTESARSLATADNRIAQVSLNFDPRAIADLNPAITSRLWFADELRELLEEKDKIPFGDMVAGSNFVPPEDEFIVQVVTLNVNDRDKVLEVLNRAGYTATTTLRRGRL